MSLRITRRGFIRGSASTAIVGVAAQSVAASADMRFQGEAPTSTPATRAPFRVGVVGLVHPHARDIRRMLGRTDTQIVGVAETAPEAIARYAGQVIDHRLVFADVADMIEKTRPQALMIYTHTYDHPRVVEVAARYGVHVMMEKPLAVSMKHTRAMAHAATSGRIHLLVNFATTWFPSSTAAYSLLHGGSIGPVRKIIVHDGHSAPRPLNGPFGWLVDPKLNGGGALFDFGCYGANLATWLMGGQRPASVTAVTQTIKPETYIRVDDEATIILTYSTAQAVLQASWNWPFSRKDMEVYGVNGYGITVGADKMRFRVRGAPEEQTVVAPPLVPPHTDGLSYLRAVVMGGLNPEGPSSLEINVIATEILDAARDSARSGRRVDLPVRGTRDLVR